MGDELDLKSLWSLIGKKIGTLGIGDSSTKTAQGIMDGATWLKNNKTVQNIGKDIASGATMGNGISAFAKKMQWLQNNPDATSEESKAFDGSIDTPAERAWLQKMQWLQENPNTTDQQKQILGIDVMKKGMHNGINMLGSQEQYSSDVLRVMTERALAAGLQPGTMEFREFIMSGGRSGTTIENLGIGDRGLNTPAERDFLRNSYVGGQNLPNSTVEQGAMQGQLGAGAMPTGQPNMGALGMRAEFNRQMSALPPQEVQRVQQILAQLNDEQRKTFMQGVANGNTPLGGYGVQDENFDFQ